MRLWPKLSPFGRGKLVLDGLDIWRSGSRSIRRIVIRRSATSRLVDDVDRIARLKEIVCPAGTVVRCSREAGVLLPSAVDHDNRRSVRSLRYLEADVHLAVHQLGVGRSVVDASDKKCALRF